MRDRSAFGAPPGTATAVLLCLAIAGSPSMSSAQSNTAELAGVVRDVQGGVLPGAVVTARHNDTGIDVMRVSDAQGRYFMSALRIGTYGVSVEMPGFRPLSHIDVQLTIGQTVTIDFALQPGGLSEAITVTGAQPLLQSSNAEISDVLENREVVEFPLNGRNFLSLAQLSDSVVIPPGGTRGDALQQAGQLPNVGGQRSGHNIYLLDGVKVTDELFNNLVISPSVDSIQEFKIQKSQYPAEFGGKASALINVATRAGSAKWQGNVFGFFRDEAFDAHNYFDRRDQPVPPLDQQQFGGTLGGPIASRRSFFFGSVELQRMNRSLTRTFSVPDEAARRGDFSGTAAICDPLTITSPASVCTPFAGNRIPAERLDPLAVEFLRKVPGPTSEAPFQNLTAVGANVKHLEQISLRVDQRLFDADSMFIRLSSFDANEDQPFGTSSLQETLVPGFGRSVRTRSRNAVFNYARVFGTSTFHELRLGWLDVGGGQVSVNRGDDFASRTGLLGVAPTGPDSGYPQVSTRGVYSVFGDPASFVSRRNQHFELYSNLLFDRGSHRFKFGGYLFHLQFRPQQPDNARGTFAYTGQFTGHPLADFLLGYPTSASVGTGRGEQDARTTWMHAFVQDDWRIGANLTVNLGLRYEHNQHMRDRHNRLSSIDFTVPGGRFVVASDDDGRIDPAFEDILARLPLPYVPSSQIGWDRGLLKTQPLRLAPRTGLAYTFNNGRGVLRGGYGVFLNQWAYSVQTAFARNLPFFMTKQIDVPATQGTPQLRTSEILANDPTGVNAPSIMDYEYRVEYTQTWSGGIQYEVMPSAALELSYMGSWTLGADNATVHNVPEPGPGSIQVRREIPTLGPVRSIRFDGKSIYHAMTARLERRVSGGLAFGVSYTLSSSVDDASSPGPTEAESNFPQNVRNIFDESGEWAPSSFDHQHAGVASLSYELPFFRDGSGWRAVLGSGWRFNGMVTAQSGAPFTVNLGVDQANIGQGPSQRPDQLRDAALPAGDRTPERWFDTDAFALPAPFTFGSARRNSARGPGLASLDVAIAKVSRIGSRQLELRWEVFNAVNTANFDLPNRIFGNANFGRIFSAKNAREMQLAIKVRF